MDPEHNEPLRLLIRHNWLIVGIGVFLFLIAGRLAADKLTLSTADTPPYSNEQNTGFYDTLVVAAFERAGHDASIVRQPSDRSLADAISGAVDGEYARIAGLADEHESLVRVPERLADFEFTAFARAPAPRVQTWDDLSTLHVAFIEGWRILEDNVTQYESLTRVPDERLLFGLLLAGRVDLVIYERRRGDSYLQTNRLEGVRAINPPLAVRPMYLYLNRRNAALVGPLAEALETLRLDGTVLELEAAAFGSSASQP